MTNYEKIKSMSVDEIANTIYESGWAVCELCECRTARCNGKECLEAHKKWLESEVEE